MYERRKLIDELVATGVPAAAAEPPGGKGAVARDPLSPHPVARGRLHRHEPDDSETTAEPVPQETAPAEAVAAGGGTMALVAQGLAFDTETIEVTAGEPTPAEMTNEDTWYTTS